MRWSKASRRRFWDGFRVYARSVRYKSGAIMTIQKAERWVVYYNISKHVRKNSFHREIFALQVFKCANDIYRQQLGTTYTIEFKGSANQKQTNSILLARRDATLRVVLSFVLDQFHLQQRWRRALSITPWKISHDTLKHDCAKGYEARRSIDASGIGAWGWRDGYGYCRWVCWFFRLWLDLIKQR